jgi:carbon monoxide dehydrogenase subunit G
MERRSCKLGKITIQQDMSKYTSDTKIIHHNQQVVYDYLSNFENLGKYLSSGILDNVASRFPEVNITNFEADRDSCQFNVSGMGTARIRIVDREPHKTIKAESEGSLPVGFTFWIQLLPVDETQTKMRLTLDAEMSMMIKMMVGDKLNEGVNQLAQTLASLPYK